MASRLHWSTQTLPQGALLTQAGQGGHGRVLDENLSAGVWQAEAATPALHPSSCVTLGKGLDLPASSSIKWG